MEGQDNSNGQEKVEMLEGQDKVETWLRGENSEKMPWGSTISVSTRPGFNITWFQQDLVST